MRLKKTNLISLLTALILIFSAMPVLAAEEGGQPGRAYQIDFKVLKDGTDEVSAADQYTEKPAKVTVEDGIGYVELTLLKSGWIAAFEVEQAGKLQAAAAVSQDEEADTRTVKFPVENIREKLNARFVVEVPSISYKGEYAVQLSFDTTGMPGAPASEEPASGEAEATADESADDTSGAQTVQLSVLKDGTDEPSSLGNYTSKTGQLHERDGAYFLTFILTSSDLITAFQYEDGEGYVDAVVLNEDKEANTRTVGIVVTDIAAKQNIALEVNAGPRGSMKHNAQIVIDIAEASEEGEQPIFSDIQQHWAQAAIKEAVALGIIAGYEDHTFRPDNPITRAQLAVILTNALKLDEAADISNLADRASIPGYAAAAVEQVYAAGLVSGYEDGTFRPNATLSRAQLAVIVANVGSLELAAGEAASFSDADSIPVWAQPSIAAVVDAGLMSSRDNGAFAPGDAATRAEVVAALIQALAGNAAK